MTPYEQFMQEGRAEIAAQGADAALQAATREWMNLANRRKYSYHFEWLGRPIIQYPQDMVAMQELIWAVQPELIVETGIAHGGSLIFSASMLELNAACGGPADARRRRRHRHPRPQPRRDRGPSAGPPHHDDRGLERRAGGGRRGAPRSPPATSACSSRSTATTPMRTSSPSSRRTRR